MTAPLTRAQVPSDLTWDLTHLYASPEAWEADLHRVEASLPDLAAFKGRLGEGPATLLAFVRARDATAETYEKVAAYASLSVSVDNSSAEAQAMAARAQALTARVAATLSFAPSELIGLSDGTLDRYLRDESALASYRKQIDDVLLRRGHVLAPAAEEALAALGEALSLPALVWRRATAADLKCASVQDAEGRETPVSIARWVFGLAQSPDRGLRRRAYESLSAGLDAYKNVLATTLGANLRRNVVTARLRGYGSAVEMILAPQRVPEAVYRMILAEVHDGMAPHVRRLVKLRQRVLGLDEIHRYDLEAPLDPGFDPPTTYDEARKTILDGLAPLGQEYLGIVEAAFRDRWIDRADNVGKGSGAFCAPVYGVHSYVFTTWQDRLRNALILAHELGHAGHGMLANRRQIISNGKSTAVGAFTGGRLDLFFVEGPSTANELLVGHHILATTKDARVRRFVIGQFLGTFIHNMVTHMLEAHFEQRLYDAAEADTPITTKLVLDTQGAVFERFFGDTVKHDPADRLYWAQQPHFYTGLYPYTYAAGLSCAYNVAEAIRNEGRPAVERWLETLGSGATLPPLELMAKAGVDLTKPEPIRRAVAFFGSLVDELEATF